MARTVGKRTPNEPHRGPTAKGEPIADCDLHVALVEPEIPWNTGNVGRTALALGARLHLIHPLGFDLDERGVRRAGLDYWRHVDLEEWQDWPTFENALGGFDTVCCFTAEAKTSIWDVTFRGRSMLIFGSETRGLSPEIRENHADRLVALPMRSAMCPELGGERPVRSLNVSTAAAVALFEVLRQRRERLDGNHPILGNALSR